METRPPIPTYIKREVRQACGFGCVICGMPIYDIDHIVEYSKVKKHTADNLVLLCPNHHRLKRWMTRDMLLESKMNAFNKTHPTTAPFLLSILSDEIDIYPGYNRFNKIFTEQNPIAHVIIVEDQALLTVKKDGPMLLLSLLVHDRQNNMILQIVDNEIVFSTGVWDAVIEGTTLRIFSTDLGKNLEFEYIPEEKRFVIWQADFWLNGWSIKIDSDGKLCMQKPPLKRTFSGVSIGPLGSHPAGFGFQISGPNEMGADIGFMIEDSPSFQHLSVGVHAAM